MNWLSQLPGLWFDTPIVCDLAARWKLDFLLETYNMAGVFFFFFFFLQLMLLSNGTVCMCVFLHALFVHRICGLPGHYPIQSHFPWKWDWIPTVVNAGIKSSLPLSQDLPPLPSPPLPFHPCQECKQLQSAFSLPSHFSCDSFLKFRPPPPKIDIWVVGFSRPCCPGLSPVIGSAGWLMVGTADGRHFPQTDKTSRST